jgi:hypothetical protein
VRAEATFALEINEWGGVSEPRLVLRHAQAAPVHASRFARELPAAGSPTSHPAARQDVAPEYEELTLFAVP